MKLVLATNNEHKIREIKNILAGSDVEILTAADFPKFPDPEETGSTLEANAKIKTLAVFRTTGLPALADDSGLEVDILGGQPGVLSSRYAGPGCTFADNNRKLLEALHGAEDEKRTARFRCVAVLALAEDDVRYFEGVVEGKKDHDRIAGPGGFRLRPGFLRPRAGQDFC